MSAISLPPPKLPPRIHFFKTAISLSLRADSRGKAQIPSLRALAQDKAWQSIFTLESTFLKTPFLCHCERCLHRAAIQSQT